MDVVSAAPLTLLEALKRESRWTRIVAAAVMVAGLTNAVWIILWPFGLSWGSQSFSTGLLALAFAWAWFGYVYWRRRALEAEKPLPPTQVVHEYPTAGSAAIAHVVERQIRRNAMMHPGR